MELFLILSVYSSIMKNYIFLILAFALMAAGCSRYGYVSLNYPIPPEAYLPEHIHSITVVNRLPRIRITTTRLEPASPPLASSPHHHRSPRIRITTARLESVTRGLPGDLTSAIPPPIALHRV